MEGLQLEFNIDGKTDCEMQLTLMQKQIDTACLSMEKVRKKLFSEISELKKEILNLKSENYTLKHKLMQEKNETTQWIYKEEGSLFDVREHKIFGY